MVRALASLPASLPIRLPCHGSCSHTASPLHPAVKHALDSQSALDSMILRTRRSDNGSLQPSAAAAAAAAAAPIATLAKQLQACVLWLQRPSISGENMVLNEPHVMLVHMLPSSNTTPSLQASRQSPLCTPPTPWRA